MVDDREWYDGGTLLRTERVSPLPWADCSEGARSDARLLDAFEYGVKVLVVRYWKMAGRRGLRCLRRRQNQNERTITPSPARLLITPANMI